jgi:hypothetical protein
MFVPMNQNCVSGVAANRDRISCLAFQFWEEAGRPEGRDLEFWLGAETHIHTLQAPETVTVETVVAKPSSRKGVLTSPFEHRPKHGGARSTF